MTSTLPSPRDDDDERVLNDVATHGCHIVGVLGDEMGPAFAYSIGLFHNYDHPEIVIFGLSHPVMQALINLARDAIRDGKRFLPGHSYAEFSETLEMEFRPIHASHHDDYFGYAQWFYRGGEFPVLQLFWPDKQGRFPWHPEAEEEFRALQPMLQADST